MTPTKTECTTNRYAFGQLERRQVVVDFSGGQITTDGGLILVAQVDQHYRVSGQLAECFGAQGDKGTGTVWVERTDCPTVVWFSARL